MQGGHLPRGNDHRQVVELSPAASNRAARRRSLLACLLAVLPIGLFAAPLAAAPPTPPLRIVLDPGHHRSQPGALGVRGIYEVTYNDRLSAQVAQALRAAGFVVVLTRGPDQEISLEGRAQLANDLRPDLFLAIHHDSAQLQYLEKIKAGKLDAYRTVKPIAGYSLFVSKLNPRFAQSLRFAQMLGRELVALGRKPAMHHAEPIAGENRELLDKDLGIYRYDGLLVLRKTEVPAVLLEAGVIPDPGDEAYVSDAAHQAELARAVVEAVRRYAAQGSRSKPF